MSLTPVFESLASDHSSAALGIWSDYLLEQGEDLLSSTLLWMRDSEKYPRKFNQTIQAVWYSLDDIIHTRDWTRKVDLSVYLDPLIYRHLDPQIYHGSRVYSIPRLGRWYPSLEASIVDLSLALRQEGIC